MDVVIPYVHERQAVRPADRRVPADAGQGRRHVHDDERVHARTSTRWRRPATAARRRASDAAGAILYAAEKATWMAREAIQALGGNGYINDFATGRLWRDAKLYEIGAGTSEIRRMLIGPRAVQRDEVAARKTGRWPSEMRERCERCAWPLGPRRRAAHSSAATNALSARPAPTRSMESAPTAMAELVRRPRRDVNKRPGRHRGRERYADRRENATVELALWPPTKPADPVG